MLQERKMLVNNVCIIIDTQKYCKQLCIHIGMGSLPLPNKLHDEHDNIYCDPPNTSILDEFALKIHSKAQNLPFGKLRVDLHQGLLHSRDYLI